MIDTAILLAAGFGTRLAPLSWVRAKAALPVGGEAVVRRQIRWLAAAGVRRLVVNLHHLPATITRLVGHGDDLGVEVRYSWEPELLGSAGGPRRAFDIVDADRAFIVNGDTLTDLDLAALSADHARGGALVTMASTPDRRQGYNALAVAADGRLVGVTRADSPPAPEHAGCRHLHFIGVQIAERRAFAATSPDVPSEALKTLYPQLIAAHPASVRVWPSRVAFHDIGTPAGYLAAVIALAAAEQKALDCGADARVHPSADVSGSVLWDGVHVGADAVVRDSVLGDGVVVPPGRRLVAVAAVPRVSVPGGAHAHGYADGDLWIAPLGRSR